MPLRVVTSKALWIAGAAALSMIGMLGAGLAWQSWRLAQAQIATGQTGQQLAECQEANRHQTEQLQITRDELADIISRLAVSERDISRRLIARERALAEREQAVTKARAERQQLYDNNPDCAEIAELELCAATDTRIRARLNALQQGP